MPISHYIDQLTTMRMNRQNGHISPHKAIMMLAVIDLIASGETDGNQIVYGPELLEHFRRYFDAVKNHHWAMDQELIFPCSDNLWHVRKGLDDRIDSQRSLLDLNGKSILFPRDILTGVEAIMPLLLFLFPTIRLRRGLRRDRRNQNIL